jgi:hypothetical protein
MLNVVRIMMEDHLKVMLNCPIFLSILFKSLVIFCSRMSINQSMFVLRPPCLENITMVMED